jgi:hypothetical protein
MEAASHPQLMWVFSWRSFAAGTLTFNTGTASEYFKTRKLFARDP